MLAAAATSKRATGTDSLDPKSFLAVRPPGIHSDSHRGLKITSRDATHYTCERPTRQIVRELNYRRRVEQMTSRGFRSINSRPYRELEPVELSTTALALHAVGQDRSGPAAALDDDRNFDEESLDEVQSIATEMPKVEDLSLFQGGPIRTPMIAGRLESLQDHKKIAEIRLKDVKRGYDLFRHIKEEDQERLELSQEEAKREMEMLRSDWKQTPKPRLDNDGDDALSTASPSHVSVVKKSRQSEITLDAESPDSTERGSESSLFVTQDVAPEIPPTRYSRSEMSTSRNSRGMSANSNCLLKESDFTVESAQEDRTSLYRYLRSLQWILEAMLQGSPAYMPSITASWGKGSDVLKDIKGKESVETRRRRDDEWDKWASTGYSNRTDTIRSARTSTTSAAEGRNRKQQERSGAALAVPTFNPKISTSSSSMLDAGAAVVPDEDQDVIYEQTIEHVSSSVYLTDDDEDGKKRKSKGAEERRECFMAVKSGRSSAKNRSIRSLRAPLITPRMTPWNRWKPVYGTQATSEEPKARPKSSPSLRRKLTGKEYEDFMKFIEKPDEENRRDMLELKRMDARRTNDRKSQSSVAKCDSSRSFDAARWQSDFTTVINNQDLVVHEQLSAMQRDRYQACCQKFVALGSLPEGGKFWEDIEIVRSGVATETASMAMRKLLMNYHWYTDLLNELPIETRDDIKCRATVDRLEQLSKQFSRLGPLKLSKERLLYVLGSFRPWEREAPDVKKAIEFIRTSVIYVSDEEYEAYVARRDAKRYREREEYF